MSVLRKEHSGIVKDSSLLMAASLLSGFFYSMVHLLLIRKMDGTSYAMFVALMALLKIMNVPSMALMTSLARYTSQFMHEKETAVWVTIVKRAFRKLMMLGTGAFLIWVLMAGVIRDAMNVPSRLNIIMLGVVAFLGLFTPVIQGTLQGARFFGWMAVAGVSNAFFRVAFCFLALVIFGSQVSPMLAAVAGGSVMALAIGFWPFRTLIVSVKAIDGYDTKPVYGYFWPVLVGQGAVFFITELDLILAPRYLAGDELGAYCKAAMLTRCIFLLTQPLATALFPRVVIAKKKWLTLWTIGLSLGVSALAACFVFFFTDVPIRLLRLNTAPVYGELLRLYVWAALPLSIISVMAPYLWARNKLTAVLGLVPIGMLYAGLRYKFSGSAQEMIVCLAVALWLAVFVLGASLIKELRSTEDVEEGSNAI